MPDCGVIAGNGRGKSMPLETCPTRRPAADGGAARGRPRTAPVGAAPPARRPGRRLPTGAIRWRCWSRPAGIGSRRCCRSATAACRQSPFAFLRGSAAVMAADLADHADQRHLGAVLRRLPSGEFRHLFGAGRHADLRHHRFRRDAAGTVRMGPQAPRRQRRGRCARPPDAGARLPRSRPRRGRARIDSIWRS